MSDELKGRPQPIVDPESGNLDPLPLQLSEKAPLPTLETAIPLTKEKEKPVVLAPKPAPKPKRQVPRWVLWSLWFNTYRYSRFSLNIFRSVSHRFE